MQIQKLNQNASTNEEHQEVLVEWLLPKACAPINSVKVVIGDSIFKLEKSFFFFRSRYVQLESLKAWACVCVSSTCGMPLQP